MEVNLDFGNILVGNKALKGCGLSPRQFRFQAYRITNMTKSMGVNPNCQVDDRAKLWMEYD